MAVVNGVSGYTQYTDLNVINSLLFNGFETQLDDVVFINKEADFPVQDSTTITLEDQKKYILGASFSTAKGFVSAGASIEFEGGEFRSLLTYTGTGDMFTGVNTTAVFSNINVTSSTANQIFNYSDTVPNTNVYRCTGVRIDRCKKWGTYTNLASTLITGSSCVDADDGVSISDGVGPAGTVLAINEFAMLSTSATFVGLDLESTVFPTLEINNYLTIAPFGATGLKGLASSGNIAVGSIATVTGSEFLGDQTPVTGITTSDIRWAFGGNSANVKNSMTIGDAQITPTDGPQTVTISTPGTFVAIGGSLWTSEIQERLETDAAGIMTYLGERDIDVSVISTATISKVGGGSDELCMRIAIDTGSGFVTQEKSQSCTQNNAATSVFSVGSFVLSQNDKVQLFVSNEDTTANIIIGSSNLDITLAG